MFWSYLNPSPPDLFQILIYKFHDGTDWYFLKNFCRNFSKWCFLFLTELFSSILRYLQEQPKALGYDGMRKCTAQDAELLYHWSFKSKQNKKNPSPINGFCPARTINCPSKCTELTQIKGSILYNKAITKRHSWNYSINNLWVMTSLQGNEVK